MVSGRRLSIKKRKRVGKLVNLPHSQGMAETGSHQPGRTRFAYWENQMSIIRGTRRIWMLAVLPEYPPARHDRTSWKYPSRVKWNWRQTEKQLFRVVHKRDPRGEYRWEGNWKDKNFRDGFSKRPNDRLLLTDESRRSALQRTKRCFAVFVIAKHLFLACTKR